MAKLRDFSMLCLINIFNICYMTSKDALSFNCFQNANTRYPKPSKADKNMAITQHSYHAMVYKCKRTVLSTSKCTSNNGKAEKGLMELTLKRGRNSHHALRWYEGAKLISSLRPPLSRGVCSYVFDSVQSKGNTSNNSELQVQTPARRLYKAAGRSSSFTEENFGWQTGIEAHTAADRDRSEDRWCKTPNVVLIVAIWNSGCLSNV